MSSGEYVSQVRWFAGDLGPEVSGWPESLSPCASLRTRRIFAHGAVVPVARAVHSNIPPGECGRRTGAGEYPTVIPAAMSVTGPCVRVFARCVGPGGAAATEDGRGPWSCIRVL